VLPQLFTRRRKIGRLPLPCSYDELTAQFLFEGGDGFAKSLLGYGYALCGGGQIKIPTHLKKIFKLLKFHAAPSGFKISTLYQSGKKITMF
jgi:hypothetical protein